MDYLARLRSEAVYGADIEKLEPPAPLIEGVLDRDSLAVLWGQPGAGKSLVGLDWALCVGMGLDWYGHPVNQGPVVYSIGEGLSGTGPRHRAWRLQHGHESTAGIVFTQRASNLLWVPERLAFTEWVAEQEPVMVVMDTLARHFGGDENSPEDMGKMIEAADEVRRRTSAGVLMIHHPGKDASKGSRGHSSLLGAVDTEIRAVKTADRRITLTATKQKNHEDGHTILVLEMQDYADSQIVVPVDMASLPHFTTLALTVLGGISSNGSGASFVTWRLSCVEAGIPRGSMSWIRKKLLVTGRIEQIPEQEPPHYRIALDPIIHSG